MPITVAFLFLAAFTTRRENYAGQIITIVVYFAAMAYFIFKLVRMYDTSNMEKVREYLPARTSLTWFAIITILLLVVTIIVAAMCTRNFNKGLKPHVQSRKLNSVDDRDKWNAGFNGGNASDFNSGHQLDHVPQRMTID